MTHNKINLGSEKFDSNPTGSIMLLIFNAIWWSSFISAIVFIGINCHKFISFSHHHIDVVESATLFTDKWCNNHEHVIKSKTWGLCERYKKVAKMNPFWESVAEVLQSMEMCSDLDKRGISIHDSHNHLGEMTQQQDNSTSSGVDNGIFSCDAVFYIFVGICISVFVSLIIGKFLLRNFSQRKTMSDQCATNTYGVNGMHHSKTNLFQNDFANSDMYSNDINFNRGDYDYNYDKKFN